MTIRKSLGFTEKTTHRGNCLKISDYYSPRLAGASIATIKIPASVCIDTDFSIFSFIFTLIDIHARTAVWPKSEAFVADAKIIPFGIQALVLALMCAGGTLINVYAQFPD